MTDSKDSAAALAALEQAKDGLSKLPILGPALWLYAKDPVKKYLFFGDTDWVLLPPVVLDQCRLYSKNGLPYAYITWAKVNDAIDKRLRDGGLPKLAPHEWNCGENVWIIDVITPFGEMEESLADLRKTILAGIKVNAFIPDKKNIGAFEIQEWPPESSH